MITPELNEDDLFWFNQRYATIESSGDYFVVRVRDNSLYATDKFIKSLAHLKVVTEMNEISKARMWLESPHRRHYPDGLDFDPSKPPASQWMPGSATTIYNLWKGFPVMPCEGDVTPFLSFMREIICAGDENVFDWVLGWCADMVQNPASRPGTALVLQGGQGIGKSFFAQTLGKLFGGHFLEISSPDQVTGSFNAHLRDKVLVYSDEGCFLDAKQASILKNMITSDKLLVHEKYRTPYQARNCVRLIISGNHDRLVSAGMDERRYCIVSVNEDRKEDHNYFSSLQEWADNGGIEALMHYFLRYEINVNLRQAPRTTALAEHKFNNLTQVEQWWLDCLKLGQALPHTPWTAEHNADRLQESFAAFAKLQVSRSSQTQLGAALAKLIPNIEKKRRSCNGKSCYVYRFPQLEECRRHFEKIFQQPIDWTLETAESFVRLRPNLTVIAE